VFVDRGIMRVEWLAFCKNKVFSCCLGDERRAVNRSLELERCIDYVQSCFAYDKDNAGPPLQSALSIH
jgi:hypothetical protein